MYRFSELFRQLIRDKILYKDFHLTCDMLLHYLVKVENRKMLLIFEFLTAERLFQIADNNGATRHTY